MSNRFLQFFYIVLATFIAECSYSQRVQNSNFDKKIDNLISYKVPVLSVAEVQESLDSYYFLDARELDEFRVSHIPGARHIGYDDFDISKISDLSKDTTIVVYCSIGYRSDKIGGRLEKAGFTRVYNLYGSIFEWVNQGHKIVDNQEERTFELHTYNKKWSKWVENPDIIKVW